MIHLFFRQKRENANSIEMVFRNLSPLLLPHKNVVLPKSGASISSIFHNIIFAYKNKGSINHITGDTQYIAIVLGKKTLLTIHDIGSALRGNKLKRTLIKWLWFKIPAMKVSAISVISEYTKKQLISIIPNYASKIHVIYNAFNTEIVYKRRDFNEDEPTILHIGTKNNKNLERVIEALHDIQCKLVIIGKLNITQISLLEKYKINFINFYDVPYTQIVKAYQDCDLVSFPSTYEGFGLPILEANAAGRPILCSDLEVLHEVASDAAIYVNPNDTQSIHNGFMKLITDSSLRLNLIDNGFQNIKRFSPENIASQYNELYKLLYLNK